MCLVLRRHVSAAPIDSPAPMHTRTNRLNRLNLPSPGSPAHIPAPIATNRLNCPNRPDRQVVFKHLFGLKRCERDLSPSHHHTHTHTPAPTAADHLNRPNRPDRQVVFKHLFGLKRCERDLSAAWARLQQGSRRSPWQLREALKPGYGLCQQLMALVQVRP
jgi:hypothetical protein